MIPYIERKTLKDSIKYKGKTYHLKKVYDSWGLVERNAVGYDDYYKRVLIIEVEGKEHYDPYEYAIYVGGRRGLDRDWW